MSGPGPEPQTVDAQEVQFWMEKAVEGVEGSPEVQRDTCLHLGRLRDFLQGLLTHIHKMVREMCFYEGKAWKLLLATALLAILLLFYLTLQNITFFIFIFH